MQVRYGCSDYRPDCHGILLPGRRGRLLSVLYTAGGPGLHPVVLLLHGIPGCERNFDLAHALRRAGFHVLVFHYSGSWGSDGNYSLSNDLEDANTALDWLLKDETYGIDKARIYAAGHSLGGFVCAQLTARRPEIRAGVLLMPCDIGRLPQIIAKNASAGEELREVLNDSAQWLTGTNGSVLYQEAKANSSAFRFENLAVGLSQKPLLCVAGTLDTCTPPEEHCAPLLRAIEALGGKKIQVLNYPTDHFFSDYRETVAGTVTEFLLSQPLYRE